MSASNWMTPKRFATKKPMSAIPAVVAFLNAHRTFLDGYQFLSPILKAYDEKKLPPSQTLQAVQSALLDHVLQSEIKSAQAKMMAQPQEKGSSSAYSITLMCKVFKDNSLTDFDIQVGTIEEITPVAGRLRPGPARRPAVMGRLDGRAGPAGAELARHR